jgi:hypothetical protein
MQQFGGDLSILNRTIRLFELGAERGRVDRDRSSKLTRRSRRAEARPKWRATITALKQE